jgi:hypothetical protein
MKRLLMFLSLIAFSTCGGPTAPTPAANLVASGALSVQGCQVSQTGGISCLVFTGSMQNQGQGCGQHVRGTTTTVVITTGARVGSADWTYAALVRPNEQFSFSGGPIVFATPDLTYNTTASWDDVRCP